MTCNYLHFHSTALQYLHIKIFWKKKEKAVVRLPTLAQYSNEKVDQSGFFAHKVSTER